MNLDSPPIANPHVAAPRTQQPRSLLTILSASTYALVGVLVFVLGVIAATQVMHVLYDTTPSHDRDVNGMIVFSMVALCLCLLGAALVRRAWQIWHPRKAPSS